MKLRRRNPTPIGRRVNSTGALAMRLWKRMKGAEFGVALAG
jgi:hypothetical protein